MRTEAAYLADDSFAADDRAVRRLAAKIVAALESFGVK